MADYDIHQFNPQDRATQKEVLSVLKHRGIDLYTQYAFHRNFCLATKHREDGMKYTNLAFPLTVPKDTDRLSVWKSEAALAWMAAAVIKGRRKGAIRAKGYGLPAQPKLRLPKPSISTGSRVHTTRWPITSFHQANDKDLRKAVSYLPAVTRRLRNRCGCPHASLPAKQHICFDTDLAESSLPRTCNRRCTGCPFHHRGDTGAGSLI